MYIIKKKLTYISRDYYYYKLRWPSIDNYVPELYLYLIFASYAHMFKGALYIYIYLLYRYLYVRARRPLPGGVVPTNII